MVNDLVLQVDGGHVLRVGHGHGEQDAHEQVDHLERQAKGEGSADDTAAPPEKLTNIYFELLIQPEPK